MPNVSQDFSAVSSVTTLFYEHNNADTNANQETKGNGVFLKPSSNVPTRPVDITGYFVVSATEEGKLEFHSGDGLLSLGELSDVTLTNPVKSQYICYNGTSWVNAYVDSTSPWKAPVRVATTANIVLENLQVVDGVVLAAGDRVLVKNQADPVQNGIYDAADGAAWTRSSDFSAGQSAGCDVVCVQEGTINAGLLFKCTNAPPTDVVGTDGLVFGSAVDGLTSLNGDTTPAQIVAGTPLQINVSDVGATHTFSLIDTGVTANTYGSSLNVAQIAVDSQGRITNAIDVPIQDADFAQSGIVNTSAQQISGIKTFNDGIALPTPLTGQITLVGGTIVQPVPGLLATDIVLLQLTVPSGTLGGKHPVTVTANQFTVQAIDINRNPVVTDNSSFNYVVIRTI